MSRIQHTQARAVSVGVDVGGTFTDLIGFDRASGRLVTGKALNSGVGPTQGILDALRTADLGLEQIGDLTHGTTVVTNLLIERNGATVGLISTRGFRDLLEIQLSWRRRSFDLSYSKTPPLVPRDRRLEIGGRIGADGREVEPLDPIEVESVIAELVGLGVDSLVIALYNAYANSEHERAVASIAARIAPELPVTVSTDVDPRVGEYGRVSTGALNAMAVPKTRAYMTQLEDLVDFDLALMHSAGGLVPPKEAARRPIQLAMSGPAGGVIAARSVLRSLGLEHGVTMDMGGTSCDVALIWNGEIGYRDELDIEWGIPARVRSVDVHTIGAGGGSIADRDAGGALVVGPRSAGALPGPACYGRGGEAATVTDANLELGILPPQGLLDGQLPLDRDAAGRALEGLGATLRVSAAEAAAGVHAIVNANMAQAIREITVRQGVDPRSCALVAFGGAGAQHATGVAAEVGIRHVVVPAHGSILSAVGLLSAEPRASARRTVLASVGAIGSASLERVFQELTEEAAGRIGSEVGEAVALRYGGLRYAGQSHEISIPLEGSDEVVSDRFGDTHEALFGTRLDDPVEIVDVWVEAVLPPRFDSLPVVEEAVAEAADSGRREVAVLGGLVPVHRRADLAAGVIGPCVVEEANTVTVIPAGATVESRQAHMVIDLEGVAKR